MLRIRRVVRLAGPAFGDAVGRARAALVVVDAAGVVVMAQRGGVLAIDGGQRHAHAHDRSRRQERLGDPGCAPA